jgi:NADPH:quinone reductase-like Zn-dependent oxidoreductase
MGKKFSGRSNPSAWPDANILVKTAELIDSGRIRIFVNRTFPLEEANAAMTYRMESREPGKIVLKGV